MKRVLVLLVLSALCAFAQDTQSVGADSIAGDFSPRTFRGCLSQSGDQFDLIVAGVVPRQYRLIGSNLAQLQRMVGHTVEITGTVPNTMPAGATDVNAGGVGTINFLAIDDLAASCRISGGLAPAETPYSSAIALASAQGNNLKPFGGLISQADLRSQPGSYMVVPLVGVLVLCLLKTAQHKNRK